MLAAGWFATTPPSKKNASRRVCDSAGCPPNRPPPAAEATGYRCQAPLGLVGVPGIRPSSPPPRPSPARSFPFARGGGSHPRAAFRSQSPAPPTVEPSRNGGRPGGGQGARAAEPSPVPGLPSQSAVNRLLFAAGWFATTPTHQKRCPGESVTRRVARGHLEFQVQGLLVEGCASLRAHHAPACPPHVSTTARG